MGALARAWLAAGLASIAGCAATSGVDGARPAPRPASSPDCPEVAHLACHAALDPTGDGQVELVCRVPAAAADRIIVLERDGDRAFEPLSGTRVSACEARVRLDGDLHEIYVAVLSAAGDLRWESDPFPLSPLVSGEGAAAPPSRIGRDAARARRAPRRTGDLSLRGARGAPVMVEVERTYRGQIFLADAASVALVPAGVGLLGYLFAAPIVHGINGNQRAAMISLGLRLSPAVVALGVYAALTHDGCRPPEVSDFGKCGDEAFIALGVGVLAAIAVMLVDVAWLPVIKERHPALRSGRGSAARGHPWR